jgi:TonB family protein
VALTWTPAQCPKSDLRPPELRSGFAVKTRVHVQVDAKGKALSTRVAQASGYPAFDQAVERHAMACTFKPLTPPAAAGLAAVEIELRVQ